MTQAARVRSSESMRFCPCLTGCDCTPTVSPRRSQDTNVRPNRVKRHTTIFIPLWVWNKKGRKIGENDSPGMLYYGAPASEQSLSTITRIPKATNQAAPSGVFLIKRFIQNTFNNAISLQIL